MSTGYLAPPDPSGRPAVLVLHSWWGLDDTMRDICDRLADAGHAALAPDLFGGVVPATEDEARQVLGDASPDELARLVLVSVDVLRHRTGRPQHPLAVLGYGMGGSLALWLAARRPDQIGVAISLYGAQSIDFDDVTASVQLHYAARGGLVDEDQRVSTEAFLHLGGVAPDVFLYDGVADGFAEPGRPTHDDAAAALAWERIIEALAAMSSS